MNKQRARLQQGMQGKEPRSRSEGWNPEINRPTSTRSRLQDEVPVARSLGIEESPKEHTGGLLGDHRLTHWANHKRRVHLILRMQHRYGNGNVRQIMSQAKGIGSNVSGRAEHIAAPVDSKEKTSSRHIQRNGNGDAAETRSGTLRARWSSDAGDFYRGLVPAAARSSTFRGVGENALWQPFNRPAKSFHARYDRSHEDLREGARITVGVVADYFPGDTPPITNVRFFHLAPGSAEILETGGGASPTDIDDASSLRDAYLEDLFELYLMEKESLTVERTGSTYTREWLRSDDGNIQLLGQIQDDLDIKAQDLTKAEDLRSWYLRVINRLPGDEGRKDTLRLLVNQKLHSPEGIPEDAVGDPVTEGTQRLTWVANAISAISMLPGVETVGVENLLSLAAAWLEGDELAAYNGRLRGFAGALEDMANPVYRAAYDGKSANSIEVPTPEEIEDREVLTIAEQKGLQGQRKGREIAMAFVQQLENDEQNAGKAFLIQLVRKYGSNSREIYWGVIDYMGGQQQ